MAKGKTFEWEICSLLSYIWTDFERNDIFCPTDSSGGRATRRRNQGLDTAFRTGDITFSDPVGQPLIEKWSIECKSGYPKKNKKKIQKKTTLDRSKTETICNSTVIPWDTLDLLDGKEKETTFERFWNQCLKDAEYSKREPILIFRRTRKEPCIAITSTYLTQIEKIKKELCPKNYVQIGKLYIYIFQFHEFFDWIGDKFKNIIGEINYEEDQSNKTRKRKTVPKG